MLASLNIFHIKPILRLQLSFSLMVVVQPMIRTYDIIIFGHRKWKVGGWWDLNGRRFLDQGILPCSSYLIAQ